MSTLFTQNREAATTTREVRLPHHRVVDRVLGVQIAAANPAGATGDARRTNHAPRATGDRRFEHRNDRGTRRRRQGTAGRSDHIRKPDHATEAHRPDAAGFATRVDVAIHLDSPVRGETVKLDGV
jgi:hypothetical protein